MLRIENITFRIGGRTLIENASAHVPEGHKVGFVGANGSGKTTLLKLILGIQELDGGKISLRSRCSIGIVAQEAPDGQRTPLEATLEADVERTELLAESNTTQDAHRIARIHERLDQIGAHSAPARAASILAGLGFDEQAQHRPLSSFSGGWKMRVALAAVLFLKPDLLLLDEPTNHLDLESALWLENHLRSYPNTLLMVSHDRNFLNNVATQIMHLCETKLDLYTGGYDTFERTRSMRQAQTAMEREKQEAERKRIQSFVDRFKAKATKARQAQSRVKALERMTPIAAASSQTRVNFSFPEPTKTASPLLTVHDASVGYEKNRPILSDLHLSVFDDDRIALLGSNGNGKTTLARLLSDQLIPMNGNVTTSSRLNVGYFAQDQLEQLDTRLTALGQMSLLMQGQPVSAVRSWLGRFGFAQDKADVLISGLSGGEKTRLAIALMAYGKPNIMILDEPTNHLDVDAREALIQGLAEYEGAIVLISHDRHLIETTADQLWLVRDGTVKAFFEDLDEYTRLLLADRKAERKANAGDKTDRQDKKQNRKEKADERKRLAPMKKRVDDTEAKMEILTKEKDQVDSKLSDPATYEGPQDQVAELTRRQKQLEQELATAEDQWLEAQTEYEQATLIQP